MKRRVVVTGLGVISSIGIGKDEFWKNLIAGKSGISDISEFYSSSYTLHRGGAVKDFRAAKDMSNKMSRASLFAIETTRQALRDAGLSNSFANKKRIGFICGTTNGESHILEEIDRIWLEKGENEIWDKTIAKYTVDSIGRNISSYFNGISFYNVIPTACAAGNYSIGYAYDLIKGNKIDMAIAGGVDPLTRYTFAGFGRLFAMAPKKCQPFDKNRKGMMIGEGAALLILEALESAKERRAKIYAEIMGYGLSCDADHMTVPNVKGIIKAMERAIKNSGIRKEDVGYISAHGTGTLMNDKTECQAIKKVFGDLANKLCVSSIKSMLGHAMGAASAIEAASCCLAVKNNIIPPTINYETPDPECDIDHVPNKVRKTEVRVALNNSFAFGGNNACLVIKKFNDQEKWL